MPVIDNTKRKVARASSPAGSKGVPARPSKPKTPKPIATDEILRVIDSTIQTLIESEQVGGIIPAGPVTREIRVLASARLLISESRWISVRDEMPDSDTTVLIHSNDPSQDPVWLGFHDGECWRTVDASRAFRVTHWRHLPLPIPKCQMKNAQCSMFNEFTPSMKITPHRAFTLAIAALGDCARTIDSIDARSGYASELRDARDFLASLRDQQPPNPVPRETNQTATKPQTQTAPQ